MTEIINTLSTEEMVAAGVIAKFDAETGEFLGYEATDGTEVALQSDEDTSGTPETIH